MMLWTGVILAGGESRRMGQDKAWLDHPESGETLWERQLGLLRHLEPQEIFLSRSASVGELPEEVDGLRMIEDDPPGVGPIGGILSCLRQASSEYLLILAVDLPQMTAHVLKRLLESTDGGRGAVYRHSRRFEPLAAVYPTGPSIITKTEDFLNGGGRRLQDWVKLLCYADLMRTVPLLPRDDAAFHNLNTPGDYKALASGLSAS